MALVDDKEITSIAERCKIYRRIAQCSNVRSEDIEDVVQEAILAVLDREARTATEPNDGEAYRTGIIY